MYDKMFEQAESFMKPMSDIMALNAEAFDAIREKQTSFVSEVLSDSIEYAQGIATPGMDIDSYVEKHQSYWEGLRSKMTDNAQDNLDYLSDVQEKVSGLMQSAMDANAPTESLAPVKAPIKKKPQPKKATSKVAKPVEQAPTASVAE